MAKIASRNGWHGLFLSVASSLVLGFAFVISACTSGPQTPALDAQPITDAKLSQANFGVLTPHEFEDLQYDYCEQVRGHLNTPIDWHIVVDASGSYQPKDSLPALLQRLIVDLPVREGDLLSIDAFSADYRPEPQPVLLTRPWLDRLAAQRPVRESVLGSRLKRSLQGVTAATTDLFALPDHLHSGHIPHGAVATPFFAVITDGLHDPDGSNVYRQIFRDADVMVSAALVQKLVDFGGMGSLGLVSQQANPAGLLLLIDTSTLKYDLASEVIKDWEEGARLLSLEPRQLDTNTPQNLRRPYIQVPVAPADSLVPIALMKEVGRLPGTYTCFFSQLPSSISATADSFWPTPTGYLPPVEIISALPTPSRPVIALPRSVLLGFRESLVIQVLFLRHRSSAQNIRVRTITHRSTDINNPSIPPPQSSQSQNDRAKERIVSKEHYVLPASEYMREGWELVPLAIELPADHKLRAEYPLPWLVNVGFSDRQEPSLTLEIVEQLTVGAFLQEIAGEITLWGRHFSLSSFLLFAASLLLLRYRSKNVKVSVAVTPHGHTPSADKWHDIAFYKHARYHISNGKTTTILREDGPTLLNEADREIDVIPILGGVYHCVYYRDSTREIFKDEWKKDSEGNPIAIEQFTFAGGSATADVGLFILPQTFWSTRWPADPGRSLKILWKRLRELRTRRWSAIFEYLRQFVPQHYLWHQEIPMPKNEKHFLASVKVVERPGLFILYVFAVLCSCASLACAWVAIDQIIGPSPSRWWPLPGSMWWILMVSVSIHLLLFSWTRLRRPSRKCYIYKRIIAMVLDVILLHAWLLQFVGRSMLEWCTLSAIIILGCASWAIRSPKWLQRRIARRQPLNYKDSLSDWAVRLAPAVVT